MYTILLALALCAPDMLPKPEHGLQYTQPATVWDEAFPLGNGSLGALVWGDGAPVKISLDRTDLWDLRPVPEYHSPEYTYETMRQWEKEGKTKELLDLYDNPYNRPAPTKIPAGRIELSVGEGPSFKEAALALGDATATMSLADGALQVWVHATDPVGFLRYEGNAKVQPKLVAPAFGGEETKAKAPSIVAGSLKELGYAPPRESAGDHWMAYEQDGWGGFHFAVYLAWRAEAGQWRGAWSVASSTEGNDPLALAKERVEAALNGGEAALRESHRLWWERYWNQASIQVPNAAIERQWYLDTYKFGAASRAGHPPITLQGPWTADDGKLPPWKGDYHHDLNTQLSYWPCYSGNHLTEGGNYTQWLFQTRENCTDWTRRFFGKQGMNVPMTADLKNNQIGGWRQYTHSSTTAAWLAHHFYLQWKFSMDRDFLQGQAYPYLHDVAVFLEAITNERGPDGKRTLPLSSSPEINDNKPDAWFPSITNYDLALIRWLFGAAAEMAQELGVKDDVRAWQKVLSELPDFALGEDGKMLVAANYPLKDSHRHFSHLMAIHPLGLIDVSQGDSAKRTIDASLRDLDRLGSSQWCGYSFSWLANLAARGKDGDKAARALDTFAEAFVLRNSFHCNGDQTKKGYSNFKYRPFTLEGNFAYAAGLQEMLLQSHTGTLEVFPAIPKAWKDCAFTNLRAQGAYLVSAEMKEGKVTRCIVTSEKGGTCRVLLPGAEKAIEREVKPGETWDVLAQKSAQ